MVLLQSYFAFAVSFSFPYEFQGKFVNFCKKKKGSWYFDRKREEEEREGEGEKVTDQFQNGCSLWRGGREILGMATQSTNRVIMLHISKLEGAHEYFIISLSEVCVYFYSLLNTYILLQKYIQPAVRLYCVIPMFYLETMA